MDDLTMIDEAYLVSGTIVILLNALAFAIFMSCKSLMGKYQLLLALSAADTFAGLGTFSAGLGRYLIIQNWPNLMNSTKLGDCLRAPWLPLMTIGGQLPSIIVLLIGLERIVAVHLPLFYHSKITTKHRVIAVVGATIFVLVNWLAATGERLIRANTAAVVPYPCFSIYTYSMAYNDFHNFVIISARTLGFLLSLAAYDSARRRSVKAGAWRVQMKREVKRIGVLLALSALSMLLATLPTFALWGYYRSLYVLTGSWPFVANVTQTANSIVNIIVYILLNEEFRGRLLYLCSCGKLGMKASAKSNTVLPFIQSQHHTRT